MTSSNRSYSSGSSLQAPPNMQKTWSTDSIHEAFAASSTSTAARAPSVDLDRPRKHASRSALHVGSRSGQPNHGGTTVNGSGKEARDGQGVTTGSQDALGRSDSSTLAGRSSRNGRSSHRYSEGERNSSERARFREDLSSNGKVRKRVKARTESMPASSKSSNGLRLGKVRLEAGDEDALEEEEEEDQDRNGGTDTSRDGAEPKRSRAPAFARLETIDSRTDSAEESSTTYAAGPSGYDGLPFDGAESSDSSSTEIHHFDWDTPHRRAGGAAMGLSSSQSRIAQRRLSRNGDTTLSQTVSNRRSIPSTQDDSQGDRGGGNSTPTRRRFRADAPGSDDVQSDTSALAATRGASGRTGQGRIQAVMSNGTTDQLSGPAFRSRRKMGTFPKAFLTNASGEAILLLAGCVAMIVRLHTWPEDLQSHGYELAAISIASTLYYFGLRTPSEMGTIWATDHRNYRISGDDGAMCGLLLGPLLAMSCLSAALNAYQGHLRLATGDSLPFPPWRIESAIPLLGESRQIHHSRFTALVLARRSLISLQTLMSFVVLLHLLATKYICKPHQFSNSNWRKLWSYTKFSTSVTVGIVLFHEALKNLKVPMWTDLSRSTVIVATHLFQSNLYSISRLARKSFTLGELSVVATVGMTLVIETINVTGAKLAPGSTAFVETFRRPTPLLIFQLALVVGTFMIGFLLSPLLYLSRHLAQKPLHRLRWPHKRDLHRRLLAFFFYLFATLFIVGVLGLWVWWLLDKRNPWMWAARFIVSGGAWWSRPLLIAYWAGLVSASIAGWQATVAGGKRFRMRSGHGGIVAPSMAAGVPHATNGPAFVQSASSANVTTSGGNFEGKVGKSRMTNATGTNEQPHSIMSGSASASTLFPKRAAHLSLNARRKFFHALAVLLFAPGIAYDPAFMHLAFSLAFSIFIFAEYIRYYALFPFGAALHVFLSEFTDHKDSGPVILSHFYLLTGCAGTVWIEGLGHRSNGSKWTTSASMAEQKAWISPLARLFNNHNTTTNTLLKGSDTFASPTLGHVDISMFIGVLTLGIADAVASIVGRRYGRFCWPGSAKTLEGSFAFISSLILGALLLRFAGWCEPFSLVRFTYVAIVLGIFEGISNQNDNLVLPLYGAIALSIFDV